MANPEIDNYVKPIIFENPAIYSMQTLALAVMGDLEWRHHGIGVLQGYVREHVEPEVRLHIWSRRLLKPGMDESGDVHDHRFDMISHVLVGCVLHETWDETPDPNGAYATMALTHARAAADTQYHGPTTALEGRFSVNRQLIQIEQGFSYRFPAQRFHRSPLPVENVTVTCVEKHQQREAPARLLYPIAKEPVMAFGHTPDPEVVKEVLAEAKERLEQGL